MTDDEQLIARLRDAKRDWPEFGHDRAEAADRIEELIEERDTDVVEIDLRAVMMEEIEKAAGQSPWVPPEYTMNEIVSDCCSFLREPLTALTEQLAAARQDAKEAEAYAEELEDKLAAAVELLTLCRDMFDVVAHPSDPLSVMLNETLAEIKGEIHE